MQEFLKNLKSNRGMTYVELIVVLSIFSVMSTVILFNYRDFQTRVDMRGLANDIALKFVQAQKASTSGLKPIIAVSFQWKPSYGIYLKTSTLATPDPLTQFVYFVDTDNDNNSFSGNDDPCSFECLEVIRIGKGRYISEVVELSASGAATSPISGDLSITYERPGTSATICDSSSCGLTGVRITISSPNAEITTNINIYASGRIHIN